MFNSLVEAAGYTCHRELFSTSQLTKVLKASHYGQKRLNNALYGLSQDLNKTVSLEDLTSRHIQDFALGLDFILLVPNYGTNLLFGVDVTSNAEKIESKLLHQKECRQVYNSLNIGPTGVVYMNPGDIGWGGITPELRNRLNDQFYDLLFALEESTAPMVFWFRF
jgi:hypothetical protein